ncbi:hypothetical protein JET18_07115 [Chryseobacterium sp. L7]|uniref:Uncharacterized protein n=1 Tax=Chryseobacterium endalhagicum TaxID=2797638 RepID=A0ABS1QE72_9FLAO|nr:hypothetical protein [Chryseobacterium endalhagicum]MBL1220602.1 hypothetical protein [Chryseobacterium endalhagicum]
MKISKNYRFFPMILGLILVVYFYGYKYVYKNNDHFFKNRIQAKVIKVINHEDKSLQFYYSNEYCITITNTRGDTLKIGDSISKKHNTKSFGVYRIKNGNYIFFKNYK